MDETSSASSRTRDSWWRLPLLLTLVLAAIVLFRVFGVRETNSEPAKPVSSKESAAPTEQTVSMAVDFGDGRARYEAAGAFQVGMTVSDLMKESLKLKFAQQGSGESAFLTAIDDVANEGVGGRNWMYTVNGEHADRSFGVYELQPGDQVLWTFGLQR